MVIKLDFIYYIIIVMLEIIRNIRFGHGDLNLWEIIAIELEATVDFKSTINYRQMVLTGFFKKHVNNLFSAFKRIESDTYHMISLVNSVHINQMVTSLRTCTTRIPLKERQKLAESALRIISRYSNLAFYDNDWIDRLVAVPDLMSSLADLCGEETFLKNSENLVTDIGYSANNLLRNGLAATVLKEAGWAELLVKALRARPDDEISVHWAIDAIFSMLDNKHVSYRTMLINAGAEAALGGTRGTQTEITKNTCKKALFLLMMEDFVDT
mmetsp:Transcript_7845/g.11123  ORF Transcript_7845/g.11123 Transcript_7845/m.11123 type:complete len:269 (+) Transcript_7845:188-994(+)